MYKIQIFEREQLRNVATILKFAFMLILLVHLGIIVPSYYFYIDGNDIK